ncbi:MAG TPA: sigma-70 family RNA polymerase sigma factor [Thermoleophilia bacterium]|nr:sigma-70 family RNA polymerase sigma factor [Thermoleophilia bacterium]
MDAALERNLIESARGGNRRAFGALVEQYQARLHRAACCLARNASEAEDMAQEAFVRAYMSLGRFRGDSAFYTWLFGILLNVYRKFLRLQQKRRVEEPVVAEVADSAPSPSRQAAASEELDRVMRAIEHMPPRLREVMVLRHVEEMAYEEIAQAIGRGIGTVRSRLHRARELLMTRLGYAGDGAAGAARQARQIEVQP